MTGLHGLGREEARTRAFDVSDDMPEGIDDATEVELEGDPSIEPELQAMVERVGREIRELSV